MSARRPIAAALLLALAGCAAPLPRGFYRPEGQAPQDSIGVYVEQGAEALIEARCQGAYIDRVDRQRTGTVHIQLDVARTRSGDISIGRSSITVDVKPATGGPHVRLPLSEAWSGRERVPGDLFVPGWTRRPFDLFFDDPTLLASGPPSVILLVWELQGDGRVVPGQCEFMLIPDDDPYSPSKLPAAETDFGLRNGYYLPGVQLGERRLRKADEERLHHLFHEEEGWMW